MAFALQSFTYYVNAIITYLYVLPLKHLVYPQVSWETCMQVKKQQLGLDMDQRTGSKLEKEYVKAVYCHPVYFTYMQNTLCKMPG